MTRPLASEQNTDAMHGRVMRAFHEWHRFKYDRRCRARAAFEHGQWYVERSRDGAQWSVVDAIGPGAIEGFDFELITHGVEDWA